MIKEIFAFSFAFAVPVITKSFPSILTFKPPVATTLNVFITLLVSVRRIVSPTLTLIVFVLKLGFT